MNTKKSNQHQIEPDLVYNSIRVARLINQIMKRGQKATAQKIVYDCFEGVKQKTKQDPLEVFEKAIDNAGPLLEVRSTRVGGATYQVPYEVVSSRRFTLATRWIIESALKKQGSPMSKFLAEEFMAAYNNEGTAVKNKLDTHKMAEANKAFAHFARF